MIYSRIKELCKQEGISIKKLEETLKIARGSLCKIDNNKPSSEKISKIAKFLNVSTDYLLYGEEPETPLSSADDAIFSSKILTDENLLAMIKMYYELPAERQKEIRALVEFYQQRT